MGALVGAAMGEKREDVDAVVERVKEKGEAATVSSE
jgi:hypothetical protein